MIHSKAAPGEKRGDGVSAMDEARIDNIKFFIITNQRGAFTRRDLDELCSLAKLGIIYKQLHTCGICLSTYEDCNCKELGYR